MRAYSTSSPEPVPVVVNNHSVTVNFNDDEVQWVVDEFDLSDSVGSLGLTFFLSKRAVSQTQIQVFEDNVHQAYGSSYTVPVSLDRVVLGAALEAGSSLTARYMAYVSTGTWANEVLYVANSASSAGFTFTLANEPISDEHIVVLNDGTPLTYVISEPGPGEFTFSGKVLVLGSALATGVPLVVTYAY